MNIKSDMEFSAKQIAQFIQGRIEGDENAMVNTFAKIEEGVAGAISFLANPKYIHYLYDIICPIQGTLKRPIHYRFIFGEKNWQK